MAREIAFEQIAKVTVPGAAFSGLVPYPHLFPVPCSLFPIPRKRKRAEAGVTLLEMLVSITIVSLLATTALFAWRVGVSAWEKAGAQLERDRSVLAAHQLLQEQIAAMLPYEAWTEQRGRVLFFQGEAETARFVSRYSLTHRASSGLYLVEYHVTEQEDGTRQLLLRETPLRNNEELGAWVENIESLPGGFRLRLPPFDSAQGRPFERDLETVVLLEGLRECRLAYYSLPANSQQGSWTDEWVGRPNEVPQAVRIHAVAPGDAGELTPVTIVAPVRNFARRRPPG